MRYSDTMKCSILRWLLGIWLVETVAARNIRNGEDTGNAQSRDGRDQFHSLYQQTPHLNYNQFRSSMRRAPPQVPGRRNLNEQEQGSNDQQFYNNYFANSHHPAHLNQHNLNLYQAVRLHGALETRARNEPASNTLLSPNQHVNYFSGQQQDASWRPVQQQRQWRRDEETVDGDSYEREDDLARFSLYNSYFDNDHSIKALNSMKCVTPTGSPGFCSTFRGCVPSFFTKEGELEAPALAELISTSIGFCTTNVSHHYIREQKQFVAPAGASREERRFNSVANRIICCPGSAPNRDPNQDPDRIFNDYIESQKQKTTTTTSTTTTTVIPPVEEHENIGESVADGPAGGSDAEGAQEITPEVPTAVLPEEGSSVTDDQNSNQTESQAGFDNQQVQQPADPNPELQPAAIPDAGGAPAGPEQTQPESEPANLDEGQQPTEQGSSSPGMYPPEGPGSVDNQEQQQTEQDSSSPSMMYPEVTAKPPSVGASSQAPGQQTEGSAPEESSVAPEQPSTVSEIASTDSEQPSQPPVEQEDTSSSAAASQPPSNDEPELSPVESSPSTTPGSTSPGKFPPKTQDSNIIKIYPEPVSGVNGKFTLPGGIYIVSTSTDTSNNNQPKPGPPSAGEQVVSGGVSSGDETIVGTKPIIIVTNPGSMQPPQQMPAMPHFPSDFPPMGSQEMVVPPPVDDSSIELQQRPRPSMPPIENLETASPSMSYPSSSPLPITELPQTTLTSSSSSSSDNGILNDDQQQQQVGETTTGSSMMQYPSSGQPEVQVTTGEPQQDESVLSVTTTQPVVSPGSDLQNQQPDESDTPIITTVQPQLPVNQEGALGDSSTSSIPPTTNAPLMDDEEDGNDALTIIPINENAPVGTSTTQIPDAIGANGGEVATTLASQSINIADQEQQVDYITTLSSVTGVGVQEVELTTVQPSAAISGSQDTGIEAAAATTVVPQAVQQQQITTLPPDSDESDESEEKAVTITPGQAEEAADIQKSTLPPVSNDFVDSPTTVRIPASVSHDEPASSVDQTSQEDESVPATTTVTSSQQSILETAATTVPAVPAQQEPQENSQPSMTYPPENEVVVPEMQYPTTLPPASNLEDNNVPPKIILNPGSDGASSEMETGSLPALPSGSDPVNNDDMYDESGNLPIANTMQPFPVSSPAPTGEAGESEQQQSFPAADSSASQPDQETLSTVAPIASSDQQQSFPGSEQQQPFPGSEQQQPFPGSEQQQPFPDPELSTIPPATSSDTQTESDAGSEQSVSASETSATSESSSSSNVGVTTGIPSTSSPVSNDIEQDSVPESGISGNEQQPSATGATSSDEPSAISGSGDEPVGTTNEPSGVSGSESIPAGSESSTQGSQSNVGGTESSNSGSESDSSGASIQSDEPVNSGSESLASEPAATTTEPAIGVSSTSQSSDIPDQTSESVPVSSSDDNESTAALEPVVPEKPEQQSSTIPPNDEHTPADQSAESADDELPVSSTSAPSTGGVSETEGVSQEPVPSVPSDAAEDASPVQGSPPQADSPVSSDIVQDPQPVISTSEVPQNVSSPVPVVETSSPAMTYPPSTAAPAEPVLPPQNEAPNYQILKACKFQTFFRSVNDLTYSYRHYPWLATIVGGTRPFSSGTLITDRHILTASHFLANITVSDVFNMRIHIGYRTAYNGQTEGPYAVRKVRKVIRHKGFSFDKLYNDIAVLVLDRPVRFSEDIYPVCISSNRTAYADGSAEAFETGWVEDPRTYTISQHHNYIDPHILKYFSFGYKNITWRLQEASQRVRTNNECQLNYSFLEKSGITVKDSMVCAGSGDTRSCAFRGNSGAPLFLRNENDRMTEQIGIVSFGIGCGHFPAVFTRVESFLPWLDRVVYNSR